jgi:hypothetical protein
MNADGFDAVGALVNLFGQPYESSVLTEVLARLPPHRPQKPSGYDQYVISKPGGFDLLFTDRDEKVAGRWHRKLCALFLYNEGADGHRRFGGALPFGFSFDDGRGGLIAKRVPAATWKIGAGIVPLDCPDPSHDRWDDDDITISAHYSGAAILRFQISPKDAP